MGLSCGVIRFGGVDLAWGERNADGVCVIEADESGAWVVQSGVVRGDGELREWVREWFGKGRGLVAVDAPLVIQNETGARPVDGLTHVHFGRFKCGCYPANLGKCPRPVRVGELFEEEGFVVGWDLRRRRVVAEVYPHPAMVRLFGLEERIPYKKGRVEEKRRQFGVLQEKIRRCVREWFPKLDLGQEVRKLLREPWSKGVEDETDALFCALIAYWHWLHRGKRTQVLGDLETGFILVPEVAE